MKISIITCQNTDNHGARLQAYALVKHLRDLGNEVEIIDYRPTYMDPSYKILYWPGLSIKEWAKLFFRFPQRLRSKKRHRRFVAFSKNYLPLTNCIFRNVQELRDNPPVADLYVAGSDQIWNTFFPNGTDPAFYLDFGPDSVRRESYAASFATTELRPGCEEFVRSNLTRFDRISVREESGLRILEALGLHDGVREDDPVFLLHPDEWDQIADGTGQRVHYVLVYDFFSDPNLKKKARAAAKDRHLKIYSVCPFWQSYADRNFTTAGPETFVSLVKHATLVVTNSFHAIAFCLVYQREFFFVPRPDGLNERISDLLSRPII
jgi:hypothetical protein